VASADNQTGLPVGLALGRLHHGIVLEVFRVTTPTPPQLALQGPQTEFFTIVDWRAAMCWLVLGGPCHGLTLLLSIAKWRNSLNSQSPVYDGDRQAPLDLSNLLPEGTDLDPDKWLTRHKSIPAFPRRNASALLNRRSFGSKRYF
jgi:hypothetical protein